MTYQEFTLTVLNSVDYLPCKDDMMFAYTMFHLQFGEAPLKAYASTVALNSFE